MSQHMRIILNAHSQKTLINAHTDVSSKARGLTFGLSLHQHPYFVYLHSKGSGESVHLHRLARAFAARLCDKYENLKTWLLCNYL